MNENFLYQPEGLDLQALLPEHLKKFDNKIRHFFHKLYEFSFIYDSKDKFVNLKAEYIRDFISKRKFTEIKKFLLDSGLIETDGFYVETKKCYGFRLGKSLRDRRCVKHKIELNETLKARSESIKTTSIELNLKTPEDRWLWANLQRVTLDERVKSYLTGVDENDKRAIFINKLLARSYYIIHDPYGRRHHNVVNIPSATRACILVDNKPLHLVELDICNSQPVFLLKVLYNKINTNTPEQENELAHFESLTSSGQLYQTIADAAELSFDKTIKSKLYKQVLFGRNSYRGLVQRTFERLFPNVTSVIRDIKEKDFRRLSHLLQKVESDFVYNQVCHRIMQERPSIFLLTIHDSFLVEKSEASSVLGVITEEFKKIDLQATIKAKEIN